MLARDEVVDRLNEIIVAPVTRTIRGLRTEVLRTQEDGMPVACAVMADHTAWGVELCKRVGSPRLKLLYDIYHVQIIEGDTSITVHWASGIASDLYCAACLSSAGLSPMTGSSPFCMANRNTPT